MPPLDHKVVETEFDFWVPGGMLYRERDHGARYSDDTSPLLSRDRDPSSLSPTSRLRRIEEGRKEMMEMIRDLPESCYELSLKDMVVDDKQKGMEGGASRVAGAEVDVMVDHNKQRKKKKRRMKDPSIWPAQVTRTSSMDTGSFLIRLFLPAFLTSNKKSASGNRSKGRPTPRATLDWSDHREINRELKVGRSLFPRDEWIHEGTSRSKSCTSRIEHGDSLPGCWPFGRPKCKLMKGKITRQKTCIF